MKLAVYAFDKFGSLKGAGQVDAEGGFSVFLNISKPIDVNLVVGPEDDPELIRKSSAYQQSFSANDWVNEEGGLYRLNTDITLARDIWWPWRPVRLCVRACS
ncbi:MAG: hypothetical protein IPN42_03925 [Methylococcaceae bacterium]|nr:hypothetical protein [Methylococcaceae bacterium]